VSVAKPRAVAGNVKESIVETQQIIEQGTRAETLLATDAFNGTVRSLLDQYVGVFFSTEPEQVEERQAAYYAARSVQEIINTLNQQVLMKTQVLEAKEQ
jgi:hypothetical protein